MDLGLLLSLVLLCRVPLLSPRTDLERLGRLPRLILDSARSFVRWMRGTCVRCQPIPLGDDNVCLYTFLEDVTKSPSLMKVVTSVNQSLFEVFQMMQQYIDGWSLYDQKYGLWNTKKMAALDKSRMKNETSVWFDKKLSRFFKLGEGMRMASRSKVIEFIEFDSSRLITAIQSQSMAWVNRYGTILRELSEEHLRSLHFKMDTWQENLDRPTANIEDLKFVLSNIAEVQAITLEMQIQFADVVERFRTLQMYGIEAKESDLLLVATLSSKWENLMLESKKRDCALVVVKKKFTKITIVQTKKFLEESEAYRETFKLTGPGGSNVKLDEGLEMMNKFRVETAKYVTRRDELVNAEKLFNLPVTPHPDIAFVDIQMERLDRIYAVYREQQESIRVWSAAKWSDLQIDTLTKGVDSFFKQLKVMPEELKKMATFRLVEDRVIIFNDSIPLIGSLKNEALRPRHWAKLMDVTGVKFDVTGDFTLGKLFSMDLAKYTEELNSITNGATQESKIEREIAKIAQLWGAKAFPMYAYKGNEALRVLNDCSEIVVELEDNMLNLSAMSNSQFSLVFRDELRKWEKDLSIVFECIEVWQVVQRKWMYLEGIFIGSDDIKMQLPEASKNFDKVDAQFKKILIMTNKIPNVVAACTVENRLDDLKLLSSSLDKCQKSLSDYLESKRNFFSRFFFVSDDELLSVLGTSDPSSVQQHMLKMFDNCKALSFVKQNKGINGMTSSEGEPYEMKAVVPVEGAVELWMTGVEAEMQRSLQIITKEATYVVLAGSR